MNIWILISIIVVIVMIFVYRSFNDKNNSVVIMGGIDLGVGLFFSRMSEYYLYKISGLSSYDDWREIKNYEKIYDYLCIAGAILVAIGVIELTVGFLSKISENQGNQPLQKKKTAASGEPVFCLCCNTPLESGQSVCPNCGAELQDTQKMY